MIQNHVLFEHVYYVSSFFSVPHHCVNWCEKGEHKLLEFIEEMNETAEEESTSLEEQLNLEFCWYKGEEATNQGPLQ